MKPQVPILIIEPAEIIRKGIISCLNDFLKHPNWYEATSYSSAQKILEQNSIEVIISEIKLENSNGFQLLRYIQTHHSEIKVLILSSITKREYILTARHFGARGYFSKNISPEILSENIRRAQNSNLFTSNEWFASQYEENSAFILKTIDLLKTLSKQEKKALSLFCNNYNTKEVSALMHVQRKSIDNYKNRIAKKMELPPSLYFREWIRNQGTFLNYLLNALNH